MWSSKTTTGPNTGTSGLRGVQPQRLHLYHSSRIYGSENIAEEGAE